MVSYSQLSSGQVVIHERETSSSGRPKAFHGIQEDAENFYTYTRTGQVSVYPKSDMDKYKDFLWKEVSYVNKSGQGGDQYGTLNQVSNNITDVIQRITPATDYEISMGYGMFNPAEIQRNYYFSHGRKVDPTGSAWRSKAEEISREHFRKLQEAQDKAEELAQLVEQQRLKKLLVVQKRIRDEKIEEEKIQANIMKTQLFEKKKQELTEKENEEKVRIAKRNKTLLLIGSLLLFG